MIDLLFAVRTCSSGNSFDENMNIFLEDSSGTIKTPGYPSGYLPNLPRECFWKIIVPTRKVVRIEFSSFRLAQHDNVVITDRINGLNPISIRRPGTQPSFKFYSTGYELSIKVNAFYEKNAGPGFIADYRAVPTGQSVSQSFSQSVSQSVSQSFSRSVGQSVSRLFSQSVSQSVSPSVRPSVSQPVSRSASQSVSQSVSQSGRQSGRQSVSQTISQ